jgi:GntR family transcriptional regulator / MocR family aminotransferase
MLRPWHFAIVIKRSSQKAVYLQIAIAIAEEIKRGRLIPGAVLPSTRELARDLRINRKTVVLAYDEMIAQGWLVSGGTRGTFVSSKLPAVALNRVSGTPALGQARIPARPGYMLKDPAPQTNPPSTNVLTFDDGAPDARIVPASDLARAWRRA